MYRTTSGTVRASGGAFERNLLMLWRFGADGLLTGWDQFDADRDAEALTRFDELAAEGEATTKNPSVSPLGKGRTKEESLPPAQPVRRVRANAATANAARFDAAIAARDADAFSTLYADEAEIVEHPTGVVYDREGALRSLRPLLGARALAYGHEPLATLGDTLALCRLLWSANGFAGATFDVGAYEVERTNLVEVDAEGRRRRVESFAADRLGDAVSRLYQRYAELLPDGPERDRAAATARSVAARLGPFDLDRYAAAFAPAIESVDHRTLGTWSARGAEALLQHYRSLLKLVDGVAMRDDDILGLRSDALLVRRTNLGTDRVGGGAYERQFLALFFFGADGLVTRSELFDSDRDDEALARFDEPFDGAQDGLIRSPVEGLTAKSPPARIENTATRAVDRLRDAAAAGAWGRFAALFPPGFRIIERRRMVQLEIDRDQYLDSFRPLFEMTSSTPPDEVLATRGDRLALLRSIWIGADRDSGSSEIEWLMIMEVDECGEPAAAVTFDPDDLDAAYAALDERYAAGEAAPYGAVTTGTRAFAAAVAARDWDALAAVLAPDLVVYDHRPLGWETLRGTAMLVATWKSLVELAPDVRVRVDHGTVSASGSLAVLTLLGAHEGGEFEDVRVVVHEYDGNGKIRQHDIYNVDQLDEARTRFAELRGSAR